MLYVAILIFMRFMPRRTGGELATMDLIFLFLIADAAGQSLGSYASVSDGLVMILVLVGWDYLFNYLSFRISFFERLTSAPPLQVIKNGKFLRRNMQREFLTEDELMARLRDHGIDHIRDVKTAQVEGEGRITVVKRQHVS